MLNVIVCGFINKDTRMILQRSGVYIFNFEHIQHFDLVFWLLATNILLPPQQLYLGLC